MSQASRTATISVVMATFNGGRFIGEQLESLRLQQHPPLELIVSDDGSTDDTLAIVERFKRSAPFDVIIRRNEARLGYGLNFLSAARFASGRFIAFCDQDDVWFPEKLETALDMLKREQAELLVHAAELIDDAGNAIGAFAQGIEHARTYAPLQLPPWGVFYGFSMVFERKVLELIDVSCRGLHTFEWQGLLSHDLWVYFLCTSLFRVVVHERPLAKYRQHSSNQTPHINGTRLRRWMTSLGVAAHPQLRRDEIAAQRAQLLDELSHSASTEELAAAACRAARYWERIARYEAARIEFYRGSNVLLRSVGCTRLALSGGYFPYPSGGLGWRLLIKDALVGVLQAKRLRSGRNVD